MHVLNASALQITVSKLHRVLERENLDATEEVSPGFQLVEVKCQVPRGEHLLGTQALSETPISYSQACI